MTQLNFASWAQPAAGAAEADVDPADSQPDNPPDPPARASLSPVAVIKNTVSGDTRDASGVPRIDMLGPEGVVGLEPGQIIARFPVPGSAGSEAINLAAVEFNSTDLPWRFSPARAGDQQRLRPWLVLIVVPVGIGITAGSPLPTMSVPVQQLPDLAESWAWAHVQLDENAAGTGRSRLLCPRKLPPDSSLQAAVVPAFLGGVQAGLGQRVDPATAHAPAWTTAQANDAVLPVYDYWQFSTGKDADFEFLARRIRPARREALGDFGYRLIDINQAWFDEELSADPAIVALGGALRPLGDPPPTASPEQLSVFATRISEDIGATSDGALGPPLRGGRHAMRTTITPTDGDWLDEANRAPSRRMAAARGVDWVQANQEELMAQAWTQAGQIREAAKQLARSRAAVAITESLQARHVAHLTTDELVTLTAPSAARARLDGAINEPTLKAALGSSTAPAGLTSTAMARLVRPTGVVGVATQTRSVMSRAVAGTLTQAIATGYTTSKLGVLAREEAAPAAPANPVSKAAEAAAVDAASVAATSLWVASKVAQQQGVSIATTFKAALGPEPTFADGPGSVAVRLVNFEDRKKLAVAITKDQLTTSFAPAPAAASAISNRDGLQIAAPAAAALVKSAFDSTAAVRRRLASKILRNNAALALLDPVLPTPDVPTPMSMAMLDRDPEWFLPGIGSFPQDRATLLTVDDAFVESVMLGANVELLSEFLWREFPTDRRGTPIARFWPRPDAAADIKQIHTWTGQLGSHTTIDDTKTTVLLIRAELFVRYPNTVVLAAQAEPDPGLPNHLRPVASPDGWRKPLYTVKIDASTRAIAFPVPVAEVQRPVAEAPGWFFVLVEPPTSIRFGFDLRNDPPTPPQAGDPPDPATWNDLTWDHVIDVRGFANARSAVVLNPPKPPPDPQWGGGGACAADVARIALQRPVRVALHASTMIPAKD